MIAECTGTPPPAEPHRGDCPRTQLPLGDAWYFLCPAVRSWSLGTRIHTHTLFLTHSSVQRLLLRRILCSDTFLLRLLLPSIWGFETWGTLPSAGREQKADVGTGQCRVGECSGQTGCLSAGCTAVQLDQPRTHQVPSHIPVFLPPPSCPPVSWTLEQSNMIFMRTVLVLFFSGTCRNLNFYTKREKCFCETLEHNISLSLGAFWLASSSVPRLESEKPL